MRDLGALVAPVADALCPVCSGVSTLFDVVDFSKNCEEARGKFLPLTGTPVYYNRCASCGHCFAPAFLKWSSTDFAELIYNDDYVVVDPDYVSARPIHFANLLEGSFGSHRSSIRHLDFGGGNGDLSRRLVERGWNSSCYDPFGSAGSQRPTGPFDLITAFEVFEHAPDPKSILGAIRALMAPQSMLLLSTLLSDGQIVQNGRLGWWYAAPRNGHVSLYSRRSLGTLAAAFGLQLENLDAGLHLMYDTPPPWASEG